MPRIGVYPPGVPCAFCTYFRLISRYFIVLFVQYYNKKALIY
nr:MAG TPA: hypothetical protein [Caudoviricetes sp.]